MPNLQDATEAHAGSGGTSMDVPDLRGGRGDFGGPAKIFDGPNRERAVAHGGDKKRAVPEAVPKLRTGLEGICRQRRRPAGQS